MIYLKPNIFFLNEGSPFGFRPNFASPYIRLPQRIGCCLIDASVREPHFFFSIHLCANFLYRCGTLFLRHMSSAAPQPRSLATKQPLCYWTSLFWHSDYLYRNLGFSSLKEYTIFYNMYNGWRCYIVAAEIFYFSLSGIFCSFRESGNF